MEKYVRTRGGGEYYEPIVLKPGETLQHAYNNPDNHYLPFRYYDRVRIAL